MNYFNLAITKAEAPYLEVAAQYRRRGLIAMAECLEKMAAYAFAEAHGLL